MLEFCCHSGVELHLADWVRTQRGVLNHLSWGLMAWPGWSPHDVILYWARACVCAGVWVRFSVSLCVHGLCLCGSVYVYMCVCIVMSVLMYTSTRVCATEQVYAHLSVCVCVCSRLLPPTGWSFTFRTGRRDRRLPGCARSLGTVRLAMPGIH